MRGIFTLRNLSYAFLLALLQATALQAASQNNSITTCGAPGNCGNIDESFNNNDGNFSSPGNNFAWTNNFDNWRVTLTANNTYRVTSGLYNVGNSTTANIGFTAGGSGGNDISSYTINILNINGILIATCGGTFTTNPPNGTTNICRSLNDLDIQNQTVRIEFVFTADGAVPTGDVLSFDDFRTNLNEVVPCDSDDNNCPGGVNQDFDEGNRGDFISTTGFVYNPGTNGNGFFQIPAAPANNPNANNNRQFSLISGRYQVGATSLTVTTGFDFAGTLRDDIDFLIVNIRNDANTILATCTFENDIDDDEDEICVTLNDPDLTGQAVRVEFVFDTDGNAGGNFQFDDFRINLPQATALPVDFISFTAQKATTGVQLLWTVGTEVNVAHYDIERSSNGSTFTKIGSVPAIGSPRYSFTDAQSQSGTVYYRVRNVDHDGQFAYTTILKYKNGQAETLSKVFPTTTRGQVTLQHAPITGQAQITITSLEGRVLRNLTPVRGAMSTPIDLSAYATGTYLLRFVKEDGQSETFRIIKQ